MGPVYNNPVPPWFFSPLVAFTQVQWVFTNALGQSCLVCFPSTDWGFFASIGDKRDRSNRSFLAPPTKLLYHFPRSATWWAHLRDLSSLFCEHLLGFWKKPEWSADAPNSVAPRDFIPACHPIFSFQQFINYFSQTLLMVSSGIHPKWVLCILFLSADVISS